jgi:crooked neck
MNDPTKERVKTQKVIPVKNKTPAPLQITAEQLLREAKERQLEYVAPVREFKKKNDLEY